MNILIASDGSAAAEQAVPLAGLIAKAYQARVSLLGIRGAAAAPGPGSESLERSRDALQQSGLDVDVTTATGAAVTAIAQQLRRGDCDLVVIGIAAPGHGGFWRRANRVNHLIESVAPPVLVVPAARAALRRILFCTGGTARGDALAAAIGDLAGRVGAAVDLFHVLAAPPALYADLLGQEEDFEGILRSDSALGVGLRRQKALLEAHGASCSLRLRHGLVVPELEAELRESEYDLVAVGTPRRGELLGASMLGKLSRVILREVAVPVWVGHGSATKASFGVRELVGRFLFRRPAGETAPTRRGNRGGLGQSPRRKADAGPLPRAAGWVDCW